MAYLYRPVHTQLSCLKKERKETNNEKTYNLDFPLPPSSLLSPAFSSFLLLLPAPLTTHKRHTFQPPSLPGAGGGLAWELLCLLSFLNIYLPSSNDPVSQLWSDWQILASTTAFVPQRFAECLPHARHCCLRSYHSISEGLGHSREVTRDARVQSAVCVHLHQTTLPTPEPARGNSV